MAWGGQYDWRFHNRLGLENILELNSDKSAALELQAQAAIKIHLLINELRTGCPY